jgi:NAD dependent epimerase/dehydratase family enzyme
LATRLGLGAVLGSGRQIVSWIHLDDAVALVRFAIDQGALFGPINAVAPHAVAQRRFAETLAAACARPLWLRVPETALRVALGELSQLFIRGQNVVPKRASAAGFRFRYPTLEAAMRDLVGSSIKDARRRDSSAAGLPRSP